MITDQDIEKLKQVFATKDDLNRFATKADFDRFVTKDDLHALERGIRQDMATKDDLAGIRQDMQRFATKEDVESIVTNAIERNNTGLLQGINTIIDMIGEINDRTDTNTAEVKTQRVILGEHEERLQALEKAAA